MALTNDQCRWHRERGREEKLGGEGETEMIEEEARFRGEFGHTFASRTICFWLNITLAKDRPINLVHFTVTGIATANSYDDLPRPGRWPQERSVPIDRSNPDRP